MNSMIRLLGICLCLLMVAEKNAQASHSIALATEPLGYVFGEYRLQAELPMMEKGSLIIPLEINHADGSLFKNLANVPPEYFTAGVIAPGWTINSGAGFKFYATGSALSNGAYIQAGALIGLGQRFGTEDLIGLFQQRFQLGYTWVTQQGLVIDVFGGLKHSFYIIGDQSLGFVQMAGFQLGYAF